MRVLRFDGSQSGFMVSYIWQSALIALAAGAMVYMASNTTPFQDFYNWTYDFVVVNAGLTPPSKQIVLVDFDDETFAKIQKFPIPRDVIAQVVARVGAQRPKIVGMDILLSEARTPAEDKAMLDALKSAGTFVLARQEGVGDIPTEKPIPMFCQPESEKEASGFCKEDTGAFGYGSINLQFGMTTASCGRRFCSSAAIRPPRGLPRFSPSSIRART